MRMERPVYDKLIEFCEDSGQSKTTAVERAILLYTVQNRIQADKKPAAKEWSCMRQDISDDRVKRMLKTGGHKCHAAGLYVD